MWKSFITAVLTSAFVACGGGEPPKAPGENPSTTSSSMPATDAPPVTSSSASPSGSSAGCKDKDGKVHAVGEEWNDGCNNCSCGPNGAKCTRRACP